MDGTSSETSSGERGLAATTLVVISAAAAEEAARSSQAGGHRTQQRGEICRLKRHDSRRTVDMLHFHDKLRRLDREIADFSSPQKLGQPEVV